MADITNYLTTIINGVYGEDVRQAIHDAISACYADGKAGATDKWAREQINALLAKSIGASSSEEVLYDGEVFIGKWTGDNLTIECPITLTKAPSLFPYVLVYYKVIDSAVPEIKMIRGSDFETGPVVISDSFLEENGTRASIRQMHIRRRTGDGMTNLNYEAYYTYSWALNSDSEIDNGHDVGVRRVIDKVAEENLGIILCKITGFNPVNDNTQQIIDNLNILMQLQEGITKEETTTLFDITMPSAISSNSTYIFDLGSAIPYQEKVTVKLYSDKAQEGTSELNWRIPDLGKVGEIGMFAVGLTECEYESTILGNGISQLGITSPTIGATYRLLIQKTTKTYSIASVEDKTLIL